MTMIVRCFFVPLVAAVALVSRGAVADEDPFGIITICPDQFYAVVACFTPLLNGTTFADDSFAEDCQACVEETTDFQSEEDITQSSCSDLEARINEALAGCISRCELGGCTKEITDLTSCSLTSEIGCIESGVIAAPTFGWVVTTAVVTMMTIFVS